MRSGSSSAQHVPNRAVRARAERLWRETVASSPTPRSAENGSDAVYLPLPPSPKGGGGTQAAADAPPLPAGPATRKLRALWISAFHLGLIRDSSDAALAAWLCRLKSLDAETCLTPDGIAHAIQPLEAWLARSGGVDWRPHLSLGRRGHVREVHRPRARVLEAQWRILHRQGRVRIGSHAALGAYAARFADLGRADSHLALNDAQADALIRHLGRCIRKAGAARDNALGRRGAQAPGRGDPSAAASG